MIVAVWAPGRGASSAWRNVPTWRCSPIWVDLTWNRVGRATSKLILIATGGVVYYGLLVRRELLRNLLNVSYKTFVRVSNKQTYSLGSCSLYLGSLPQLHFCEPPE